MLFEELGRRTCAMRVRMRPAPQARTGPDATGAPGPRAARPRPDGSRDRRGAWDRAQDRERPRGEPEGQARRRHPRRGRALRARQPAARRLRNLPWSGDPPARIVRVTTGWSVSCARGRCFEMDHELGSPGSAERSSAGGLAGSILAAGVRDDGRRGVVVRGDRCGRSGRDAADGARSSTRRGRSRARSTPPAARSASTSTTVRQGARSRRVRRELLRRPRRWQRPHGRRRRHRLPDPRHRRQPDLVTSARRGRRVSRVRRDRDRHRARQPHLELPGSRDQLHRPGHDGHGTREPRHRTWRAGRHLAERRPGDLRRPRDGRRQRDQRPPVHRARTPVPASSSSAVRRTGSRTRGTRASRPT